MNKTLLNRDELIVYELIEASVLPITKLQIALNERWLGCHPIYEAHLPLNKEATTLRKITQIVRDLRLKYNAPILSGSDGYYLCKSEEEAFEFVSRFERTARSQAKSWMVMYEHLNKVFGVESEYFSKQLSLFNEQK